jgi:fucose permease
MTPAEKYNPRIAPPAGARGITALNYLAMAQHGLILLLVGPLLPSLMEAYSIGESTAGLLLSLGSIGFVAGPLFAGALIDRVNVRAALLAGLGIEILTLALFGVAPAFWVAVAANLLIHLGASFVETSANVMPTLRRSTRSAHAVMNLVHMFFSVGAFAGPLLIGLYLDATGEWRPVLFYALVPTGALFAWSLAVRFPRRKHTDDRPPHPFANLGTVIRMPHAILGAVSLLLYVGAEVGISSWVVYYLQRELGLTTVASAAGLSILWAAILVGRLANSILGNRLSSRTLVTASGIGGAIGTAAFVLTQSAVPAYLLLGWTGLCLAGVFPNVMAELNNKSPGHTGTVTAVMAIGAASGAALFQWIVGAMAETVGIRTAFLVPAAIQILVVVSFWAAIAASRGLTESAQQSPTR